MRLQKQLSRKIKGKEYIKWIITVPPKEIEKIGWDEGTKLEAVVSKDSLVVRKSTEPSYDEFKGKILGLLNGTQKALSWQEIRGKLQLKQAVPNNKWVRKLEKDIALKRVSQNGTKYWYSDKKGITVYTIGYEGKKPEEFIDILKKNNIQGLVDVRELALSRKNGFSKSVLDELLTKNGIVYRHYQELGSPRELRHKLWNEGNYPEFFKEYAEWLSSPKAETYLTDLEGLAHVRTTAIMCFEKDVEKCHRSIIKKKLIQDGFKVVDL